MAIENPAQSITRLRVDPCVKDHFVPSSFGFYPDPGLFHASSTGDLSLYVPFPERECGDGLDIGTDVPAVTSQLFQSGHWMYT